MGRKHQQLVIFFDVLKLFKILILLLKKSFFEDINFF